MGCVELKDKVKVIVLKRKSLNQTGQILSEENSLKSKSKSSFNSTSINASSKITYSSWIHIVNFLNFNEVKEVGKINKKFNKISKDCRVLTKFFKKKENVQKKDNTKMLLSNMTFCPSVDSYVNK